MTITVSQLIAKLQNFDGNLPVKVAADNCTNPDPVLEIWDHYVEPGTWVDVYQNCVWITHD